MNIGINDLGLAYRKAKVDLYYSSHACLMDVYEYECNLLDNLQRLLHKLNDDDEGWVKEEEFVGAWTLAAKAIYTGSEGNHESDGAGLIFSSPKKKWENSCSAIAYGKVREKPQKPKAEFRLMAKPSLDFHVLSALWMLKVGHKYDAKLGECAYGNRLRRTREKRVNPLSLGSFKPYFKPFRDWRDNGLKTMRAALEDKKKIIAITADVSSFYHELNPSFMMNDSFNKIIELDLSLEDQKLHRLFIRALEAWAQNTPLGKGLPVGLPASAVVANLALIELDRVVKEQVAPLYYGRYVDDIMMVMENGVDFRSSSDLWDWLFKRSENMLGWVTDADGNEIEFRADYLGDSKVRFSNKKNKIFVLEGEEGLTLLASISRQIQERASEWRALPNLPRSANNVSTDLVSATQNDGEIADNLRKADLLSMRRAGFAIKLRDFEAYERDLLPDVWREHRHAFFDAFIRHVLVLPCFFDLEIYLPRVIKLATACEDFKCLNNIIKAIEHVVASVHEHCTSGIKSCAPDATPEHKILVERWKTQLFNSLHQSIIAAFPPRLTKEGKDAWKAYILDSGFDIAMISIKRIQDEHAKWFSHDLAHMPFRSIGLPRELVDQRGIPAKSIIKLMKDASHLLPPNIISGIKILAGWIKINKDLPAGLVFATRPYSLAELFLLPRNPFNEELQSAMQRVVLALRGFTLTEKLPRFDSNGVLQISDGEMKYKQTIAVSSWKTDINSWIASVTRSPDSSGLNRYIRLTRLVNGLISKPQSANYFILPELALPARWFMRIAQKLQARGISLITGIEYLHVGKRKVRHQVWAALSHNGLGFPSMMIYRQDKQRPAFHEELELQKVAGLEMEPGKTWKSPPILQHGGFRFSLLVCSELTNISYRARLRGEVDALFVPEWNPDTETFNSLVESAALDVHAYIIQCNDRQYGDSRIRAPAKESWQRDVLRVKGGIDDYCVTGQIDIQGLRRFQSSYRSPTKSFKPVPDGFRIARQRRELPTAE